VIWLILISLLIGLVILWRAYEEDEARQLQLLSLLPLFGPFYPSSGWPREPFTTLVYRDQEYVVSNDGYWEEVERTIAERRNFWYHWSTMPPGMRRIVLEGVEWEQPPRSALKHLGDS
jgi:hypothetical protein